jgi:DnaK suppressor protein
MGDALDRAQAASEVYQDAAMRSFWARKAAAIANAHSADATCEDCGHPIPHDRLQANPQATRCVRCQGKFERRPGGR